MAPGRLCCGHHLFMSGVRLAEFDVVLNAVIEQVHALKDHAEIAHQTIQRIVLHINAAQLDRAVVHIPKPCHKVGKSGLAGAGRTHDGSSCPFRDGKADIADDFPLSIGKVHMLEGNIVVFRRLYGAALVHPGSAVDLLHPVDGGVNHRQHEEHLAGRLQLAIYQESGNHHHQAGKEGHTALQEKPDRKQNRRHRRDTQDNLLQHIVGNTLALELEILLFRLLNRAVQCLIGGFVSVESAHYAHALYVFQHSVHQPCLGRQSSRRQFSGLFQQQRIAPEEQDHAKQENQPNAPVKAQDRQREDRGPYHAHHRPGNYRKGHTLQVLHGGGSRRGEAAQALGVEVAHGHIFHALSDMDAFLCTHPIIGVALAVVSQIPAQGGSGHADRHNPKGHPRGGTGHVLLYQGAEHNQQRRKLQRLENAP